MATNPFRNSRSLLDIGRPGGSLIPEEAFIIPTQLIEPDLSNANLAQFDGLFGNIIPKATPLPKEPAVVPQPTKTKPAQPKPEFNPDFSGFKPVPPRSKEIQAKPTEETTINVSKPNSISQDRNKGENPAGSSKAGKTSNLNLKPVEKFVPNLQNSPSQKNSYESEKDSDGLSPFAKTILKEIFGDFSTLIIAASKDRDKWAKGMLSIEERLNKLSKLSESEKIQLVEDVKTARGTTTSNGIPKQQGREKKLILEFARYHY